MEGRLQLTAPQIVKVRVKELILDEGYRATGVVIVGAQEVNCTVRRKLKGGGVYQRDYTVKCVLQDFDIKTVETLGLKLDYSAVTNLFEEKLKERKQENELMEMAQRRQEWKDSPLQDVIKLFSDDKRMTFPTEETWANEGVGDLQLNFTERRDNDRMELTVRVDKGVFKIYNHSSYKYVNGRIQKPTTVKTKILELIENWNSRITSDKIKKLRKLNKLAVLNELLDDKVKEISYRAYVGRGAQRGYVTHKAYEIMEKDPSNEYNKRGVQFHYDEQNKELTIKEVKGIFTIEQFKKLLNVIDAIDFY